MRRVCRPGGLIVLFEHNPWNPLTRRAVRGCEFDRDAELLSRREASRLLSEAGVEDRRGRYILFFTAELRRYCEGSSDDSAGCRWARSTRCSASGPEGPASSPSALATR